MARIWFNEGNWERLRRAQEVGEHYGVTALQIALACVLAQSLEIYALVGPQSIAETDTSAQALGYHTLA